MVNCVTRFCSLSFFTNSSHTVFNSSGVKSLSPKTTLGTSATISPVSEMTTGLSTSEASSFNDLSLRLVLVVALGAETTNLSAIMAFDSGSASFFSADATPAAFLRQYLLTLHFAQGKPRF